MAAQRHRLSYRMKLFFSYVLVLVLPVVFLFSQVVVRSTQSLEQELVGSEISLADTYGSLLEDEFQTLEDISKNLSYYQGLAPFPLFGNASKGQGLITTLNRYEIGYRFFDSLYVHFYCDDYFYSASSSITSRNFYNSFSYINRGEAQLREAMANISAPFLFPGVLRLGKGAGEPGVLMVHPFLWRYEPAGVICFFIPNSALAEAIGSGAPAGQRGLYLMTAEGIPLGEAPPEAARPASLGEVTQVFNGGSLLYGRPLVNGSLYLLCVSSQGIFEAIREHTLMYALLLGITLAGGLALCFVTAKSSYSPIRALRQSVTLGSLSKADDFQYLQAAYLELASRNQAMHQKLAQGLRDQQRLLLSAALVGDMADEASFRQQCEDVGLDLAGPFYWVLLSPQPGEGLRGKLCQAGYPAPRQLYAIGQEGLYLMETQEPGGRARPAPELYVAPACRSLRELPGAYAYVRSMHDVKMPEADRYMHLLSGLLAPYQVLIRQIETSLAAGQAEAVRQAGEALVRRAPAAMPIELRRQLYYQVIYAAAQRQEADRPPQPAFDALLKCQSEAELTRLLRRSLDGSIQALKKTSEGRQPSLQLEEILAYVAKHYTLADFSLQVIAQEYGVSVSYLSQFFKERQGIGLLEYYTQLRMKKAKELLSSTAMSVTDVAVAVGYYRASSFSRRFKQLYSLTPAEYQRSCQGGSSENV